MRRILVTGANKGIGEAIVRKILRDHCDTFVLLGSRNLKNGEAAKSAILNDITNAEDRLEVITIDVSKDESVMAAAQRVQELSSEPLFGVVNNAGLGGSAKDYREVINVNYLGIERVCKYFEDKIQDRGRIVNVTSAAGPNFISQLADKDVAAALTSKRVRIEEINASMKRYLDDREEGKDWRMGEPTDKAFGIYGMSKALANAFTLYWARMHPQFIINSCTPGFIETDMTRPYLEEREQGKTAEELGMKSVEFGAVSPCKLLFDVDRSGGFYGSDGLRSPLDKYRSPGDPEYVSEDES